MSPSVSTEPSDSGEGLSFDYRTIRLLIGMIAMLFPLVIRLRAGEMTDSISWSYYTNARDLFVGLLFVIGAFLASYKGHKSTEDAMGWLGAFAAMGVALFPTSYCIGKGCPSDSSSVFHYFGAIVLFSTTVYFCLFPFSNRALAKLKRDGELSLKVTESPVKRRLYTYRICGWAIIVVMVCLLIATAVGFDGIRNMTFWAEAFALEFFGIAWGVASQYAPVFTKKGEQQKLF